MNPYDYRAMVPRGQVWIWPTPADMASERPSRAGPVRIGDTERDRAIATLGDHFAAGRLSREELDERVEAAMEARFDDDLEPLFADLPVPEPVSEPLAGARRPTVWPVLMWLMPVVLLAMVITAVLVGAPWILWGFFWVFLFSGLWRRRRYHPGYRVRRGQCSGGEGSRHWSWRSHVRRWRSAVDRERPKIGSNGVIMTGPPRPHRRSQQQGGS
jgi:hypothetical protein